MIVNTNSAHSLQIKTPPLPSCPCPSTSGPTFCALSRQNEQGVPAARAGRRPASMWSSSSTVITLLHRFDFEVSVGVDAQIAGNAKGRFDNLLRVERRMKYQGPGGGEGIWTTGADRADAVGWLNHIAGTAD